MLTQASLGLCLLVSVGDQAGGEQSGGWISTCARTRMRSVCMNGQGTSLKASHQKEIRTQFIIWQLESPLHLCVCGGRGG